MHRAGYLMFLIVVLWSGVSLADQIGDCSTTMKDGKVVKTKIYQKGGKMLIESDVENMKTKVIKDGSNITLVMDAQKMCMKTSTPPPVMPKSGDTAPSTNPDGSVTKCAWTKATHPDTMFTCPTGYTTASMMGR